MIRKKDQIWRKRKRAKTLFLRSRRPKPKRKKTKIEPKKTASGPRRIAKYITNNTRPFENLSRSRKKYERLKILKNHPFDKMFNFLLLDKSSPLNVNILIENNYHQKNGTIEIPERFSVIDNPADTYFTLQKIVSLLFLESGKRMFLDYGKCRYVELGTQMLLDIIIKSYDTFLNKLMHNSNRYNLFAKDMSGDNYFNQNVAKIVFSVGTPVALNLGSRKYEDVEKLELIKHSGDDKYMDLSPKEMTEIEITRIEEYVISSLEKMHRELNDDQKESLGIVIGEILTNAQEHSTTDCRFAAGYFAKETLNGEDVGLFRLVIMNLGHSIYEKFKDENCMNKHAVSQMEKLSLQYTQKKLFRTEFKEEELWTLYALQEGVTSVLKDENSRSRRGNGSLRFIENFFKLKGDSSYDGRSSMHIISGRASINFDGTYAIQHKTNNEGEEFAVMSFNKSGNLLEKPDSKYVKDNGTHFPGTMITIQLYLKDLQPINNVV